MYYIESERLFFRTLTLDDVSPVYVGWLNDPMVNQYLESRFSKQTINSCADFVKSTNDSSDHHLLGIFDKNSSKHIGNIKIGYVNFYHRNAQLSLFIGEKEFWNKGLATEAIIRITKWGFDELDLEKIEAGCYDANLGSLKAFLKAGYVSEGYFRQKVISNGKRVGSFWLGILKNEQATN